MRNFYKDLNPRMSHSEVIISTYARLKREDDAREVRQKRQAKQEENAAAMKIFGVILVLTFVLPVLYFIYKVL
jgi:hypothetical protein